MKTLFLILTIVTAPIFAQENLVPNGSFEEYYSCPLNNELGNGHFNQCKDWWYTTPSQIGTPDYYNACNNQINGGNGVVGVPNNFWGYQDAFDGNGYVGLGAFWYDLDLEVNLSSETIQSRLKSKLLICHQYEISLYVSLADFSTHGFKSLGVLFSKDSVVFSDLDDFILFTPTWVNEVEINDTIDWVKLEGNIIADEEFDFISIGYFSEILTAEFVLNNPDKIPDWNADVAYIYIDSLKVVDLGLSECSLGEILIENIFTPNGDDLNDYIDFTFFEKVTIVNRWGTTVLIMDAQSNFEWHGKNFREEDLPAGVYYYITEKAGLQQTGSIHLIR